MWERLQQFIRSLSFNKPLAISETSIIIELAASSEESEEDHVTTSPLVAWKSKVAVELLNSLSEHRLARVICSQVI